LVASNVNVLVWPRASVAEIRLPLLSYPAEVAASTVTPSVSVLAAAVCRPAASKVAVAAVPSGSVVVVRRPA
jgi:hypothetical protein